MSWLSKQGILHRCCDEVCAILCRNRRFALVEKFRCCFAKCKTERREEEGATGNRLVIPRLATVPRVELGF